MIEPAAALIEAIPLWAFPLVLSAVYFLCAELGQACHRHFGGGAGSAEDEGQVLNTSLLVLALLLGFTFSMALGRYDDRRGLVVQEANDIGTAWLRAGLLPAPLAQPLQASLARYAAVRQVSPLPDRTALLAKAARLRDEIWQHTARAQATLDGSRATQLVQAVNSLFDTSTLRERAVATRVPPPVILLLLLISSVSCFLLGYLLDAHGQRHRLASGILFVLISLTMLLIMELDRPSEGVILVDQSAMRDLAATLAKAQALPHPS